MWPACDTWSMMSHLCDTWSVMSHLCDTWSVMSHARDTWSVMSHTCDTWSVMSHMCGGGRGDLASMWHLVHDVAHVWQGGVGWSGVGWGRVGRGRVGRGGGGHTCVAGWGSHMCGGVCVCEGGGGGGGRRRQTRSHSWSSPASSPLTCFVPSTPPALSPPPLLPCTPRQ